MKNKLLLAWMLALATALSGCSLLKQSQGEGRQILAEGEPKIAFGGGGYLIVDQEPLLLRGRRSVTWTLPADGSTYSDFSMRIDAPTKRTFVEGGTVRYRLIDQPKRLDRELECRPVDAHRFACQVPTDLEANVLYTYTLRVKRNNQHYEVDPTLMMDG